MALRCPVPAYSWLKTKPLEEILRGYTHVRPIELEIRSDALPLPIDQAIPCGLIHNELITKAIKYAFPPEHKRNTRLTITATEYPPGQVTLSVEDNGIGMPESFDVKTARSLGLSLVSTLAQQLHGTMETGCGSGTRISIIFTGQK
jgi:two-component sensor histidine kinase